MPEEGQQGVADGGVEISVCRGNGAGDGVEGVDDEAVGPVRVLQELVFGAGPFKSESVPSKGENGVADDGVETCGVVLPHKKAVALYAVASEKGLVLECEIVASAGESMGIVGPRELVLHYGVAGREIVGGVDVDG